MKQIKGWAGNWDDIVVARMGGEIVVFLGPNAEAECNRNFMDPVPVILKLDRKKQRKVKGRER